MSQAKDIAEALHRLMCEDLGWESTSHTRRTVWPVGLVHEEQRGEMPEVKLERLEGLILRRSIMVRLVNLILSVVGSH